MATWTPAIKAQTQIPVDKLITSTVLFLRIGSHQFGMWCYVSNLPSDCVFYLSLSSFFNSLHFDFCICWLRGNYHHFAVIRNSLELVVFIWYGCYSLQMLERKKNITTTTTITATISSTAFVLNDTRTRWTCESRGRSFTNGLYFVTEDEKPLASPRN